MIPRQGVTVGNWSGQGWIVMDEETGAAGYMICGGLYGDNAVLSGGSLTKAIDNLMLQLGHLIVKILKTMDAWLIFATMVGAGVAHIVGAIWILSMYTLISLFIPCMLGIVLGMIFFAVALRVFEQLLKNIYTIRFRRRQYAYV